MYIIKMRDHYKAENADLIPLNIRRVIDHERNRWQGRSIFKYATYEEALHVMKTQMSHPKRIPVQRDYRIYEQDGRKLRLISEHLAEGV